jgi:hypothetical protein
MSTAKRIYDSVKPLPEPLAQEVLDFVTFIKTRRGADTEDLIQAQTRSLEATWDNTEDDVWNDVQAV